MKPNSELSVARILIVDDNHESVRQVSDILASAGYVNVCSCSDPDAAVAEMERNPPDILLLELKVPLRNHLAILRGCQGGGGSTALIPALVFATDCSDEFREPAIMAGASDFLRKPIDPQEILLRVRNYLLLRLMHIESERNALALAEVVQKRTVELTEARREALETLARVAELRDDETGQHTRRVGALSAAIAEELAQPAEMVQAIELAAPLHDVGKIAIPDSILMKPGKLDPAEIEVMRRHTLVAESVFADMVSPMIALARDIALNHHERWDGNGYPRGIAGAEIPLAARIVSVADVFDALTHERPYKRAWSQEEAIAEIRAQSGRQFDPAVVEAFLAAVSRADLIAA